MNAQSVHYHYIYDQYEYSSCSEVGLIIQVNIWYQ